MAAKLPTAFCIITAWVPLIVGCVNTVPDNPQKPLVPPDTALDSLAAKSVDAPDLRWRDIAGEPYCEEFTDPDFYRSGDSHYVKVQWASEAGTFTGRLQAVNLKPNFAYQMKLMGAETITGPDSQKTWASRKLGQLGRWWDDEAEKSLSDDEARAAIGRGKNVRGYILFDFFVTDERGNAEKVFALNSSYHVLWRKNQRHRHRTDSRPVRHNIVRTDYGYAKDDRGDGRTVAIFAEKEQPRPRPGNIRLPAGRYPVLLNITEESFHDNQKQNMPFGGYWAQVLESELEFTVTQRQAQAEGWLTRLLRSLGIAPAG